MVNRKEIKRLREANDWSFAEAAEAAGWGAKHRMRWHHVESGRIKDPRVSTLRAMAVALGCGMEDLLVKRKPPARRGSAG